MPRWYNEVPQEEGQNEKVRTTAGPDSRWGYRRRQLILGLAFLGLLSLTGLGIFFLFSYLHQSQRFFPDIPTKYVAFTEMEQFLDTGAIGDQAWQSMMPLGAGFFRIPHPRRYGLPKSVGKKAWEEEDGSEMFQASLTHQMHCLASLRDVVIHRGDNDSHKHPQGHPLHCLDNLRQAILCAGDITLLSGVPGRTDNGGLGVFLDGVGTVHKCRDWDFVKELLEEHQFSNYNASWLTT